MKRFFTVLTLCLVTAGLFASGGGQQQQTTAPGEKTPMNISFWWYQQDFPENEGDAFGQFVEDKFNVDIKLTVVDWGDYQQKFRLWAASDDLPDTFSGYVTRESWFAEFIREGLIRTIPYETVSRYPLLKHNFDSIDMVTQMRDFYGDNYYLPRPEAAPGFKISPNTGMYYRKDWAQKLGFQRPTDVEAFYNMLEAFVTKDPDGNGKNDTYGWTTGGLDLIYNAFGAFPGRWVNGPNGKIIPGWADEAPMIAALTWLRRAYNANLLDKEFPGASNNLAAKFGQGIFGVVSGAVQPSGVNQFMIQQFPNQDSYALVDWISGFSSTRGGTPYKDFQSETCGAVFRDDLSDEMLTKYLEIWEYMLGEEAKDLWVWGFKDIDYRVEADGAKVTLLPAGQAVGQKYPSNRLRAWATWAAEVQNTDGPAAEQPIRDFANAWQAVANQVAQNAINLGKINELAGMLVSEERSLFESQFIANTALLEIISGTGDVAAMYRAMINDANQRGLPAAVDAQTAIMKK